jgi:cytidylate kinase
MGQKGNVDMEGRDITTVVFPDAPIKIFLFASQAARAQRRFEELLGSATPQLYDELLLDLKRRDEEDASRPGGALRQAPDAVAVDSTFLSVDQVVERILQLVALHQGQ